MAGKRANGEGNIRKKVVKGKVYWEGRYTDADGKQRSVSGKTQSEVRTKLQEKIKESEKLLEQKENGYVINSNMTLNEAREIYSEVFETDLKPQTRAGFERNWNKWIRDEIGQYPLKKITPIILQNQINYMINQGLVVSSIKVIMQNPFKILKYLFDNNIINSLPYNSVKIAKETHKKKRALTDEELNFILEYAKGRNDYLYPLICVLLYTGMRIGEACALCWQDIDFDNKTIYIQRTVTQYKDKNGKFKTEYCSPKTKKSKRIIPLVNKLEKVLLEFKKSQQQKEKKFTTDTILFVTKQRNPLVPQTCDRRFNALSDQMREKGMIDTEITPHFLRHTFASKAIENKIPSLYIQEMCGWHSSNMIDNVYGHVNISQLLQFEEEMWNN